MQTRDAHGQAPTRIIPTLGGLVRFADPESQAAPSVATSMAFEAVAATPSPVLRHTWEGSYYEILDVTAAAVDVSRVASGVCPLLIGHDRWDLARSHIGIVETARFKTSSLILAGRFDSGPVGTDIARRVNVDRTLRAVSIGYDPLEAIHTDEFINGVPIIRITKWALNELSFVIVPADAVASAIG